MPASEPLLMNNVWLTCGEDREKAQTVLKVTTGHNFIKVIKKKTSHNSLSDFPTRKKKMMRSLTRHTALAQELLRSRNTVENKAEFAPTESMF